VSEPFNKAAKAEALKAWERDSGALDAAQDIGRLLRDGDMNDYDHLMGLIWGLESFAEDLKRAVETLGEEDE
jgi:hypothetical protein